MKQYKTLEEIIEEFNTKTEDLQPLFNYTSTGELIEDQAATANEYTEVYTYLGEHYDEASSDKHWAKQFASTELAVSITEAISYAVRDGLNNTGVALVLEKILSEVKQR